MNIGIISTIGNLYPWAGSEEMWHGAAIAALDAGHSVVIHAATKITTSPQVSKLKAKGATSTPRPDFSPISRRLANRRFYSRYRRFFAQKLDVLCISMGGIADCVWMPDLLSALHQSYIPYIAIVQANAEGIVTEESHREILHTFYSQAASVIFVSQHNHRLAERQLAMAFAHPVIMMNPLRKTLHKALSWPETSEIIRFAEVARLEVADKQQDHLLEALSTDEWKDRNWTLTFFGSGEDEVHIRRLIHFYGLEHKVKFGGFVEDFRDIWRDHHLHILPSRREGMPLSLIESMACGRPAVVTRAGGICLPWHAPRSFARLPGASLVSARSMASNGRSCCQ